MSRVPNTYDRCQAPDMAALDTTGRSTMRVAGRTGYDFVPGTGHVRGTA
jgi:hypothetical protein